MIYLKKLADLLWALVRALAYGWAVGLAYLLRLLREMFERCRVSKRLPGRLDKGALHRCTGISDPAYKRPDPLIYAQYYLMKQGLAVTWDNPDIELREGGVTVPSHALKPNTEYEIVARIWNNSTEAPIHQLPVFFSYMSFGVGTQHTAIGTAEVPFLGVKGGPFHPAFATIHWRTPAIPGHYCLQALILWLDDVNPNNNFGQENLNVVASHSPAAFDFQLRNDTPERQPFHFEVDTYVPPPLPPCDKRVQEKAPSRPSLRLAPGTLQNVPAQHQRDPYPLPADWTVTFHPTEIVLAPGAEITIHATVIPPPSFKGRQAININSFFPGGLAGGVTVYVEHS